MRSDFEKKVGANDIKLAPTWRSGWDSNPRAIARKLISSNFETVPHLGVTSKQYTVVTMP